jgi:hypothetical protein
MRYLLTLFFCASAFGADIGEQSRQLGTGRWLLPGFSSTTTAFDATPRKNYGVTYEGAIPPVTVAGRQGLKFDGASRISGFTNSISTSADSRTVSAWVYPTTTNRSGIVATRLNNLDSGWVFLVNRTAGGSIAYAHIGGTVLQSATGLVPQNQWSFVAVTYDSTSRLAILYLNGRSVTNATFTANPATEQVNGVIGAESTGTPAPTSYFTGSLSDVLIQARVLTPAQLAALYKEGLR